MWPLRASTQPSGELPFVGLFWVWGPLPLFLGPQHSPIVSRTWLGCRTQLEHQVRGGCSLAGPAGRIDLVAIRLCSSELTSTTIDRDFQGFWSWHRQWHGAIVLRRDDEHRGSSRGSGSRRLHPHLARPSMMRWLEN